MDFACYHPAINLIYFVSVIAGTFLFRHPVYLAVSFLSAFFYSVRRNRVRGLIFDLMLIPLIFLFALYYASYHHFGVTVLRYNFIGNPLTLESLVYGLVLGAQWAAFFMWMSCIFSVCTTDKAVYLFGRVSPKVSLFLSILLRMVPRFKEVARRISAARRGLGRGPGQGNLFRRLGNCVTIFSMCVTWLIESLSMSSDSMRSRGYGLRGRTAFSIYRFDNRDRSFVIGLFTCLTVTAMAVLLDQTDAYFAPRLVMNPITPLSCFFYLGYAVLCLLPPVLEIIGEFRFRRLCEAV